MKNKKNKGMGRLNCLFVVIMLILTPISSAMVFADGSQSSGSSMSLNVNLPDYAGASNLRFNGTTMAGAIVNVFVNGESYHNDIADSNGVFEFRRVLLEEGISNNVTIVATKDDYIKTVSKMIQVDDENPEFLTVTKIPDSWPSSTMDVSFELSEPCDVYVEIGTEENEKNIDVIGTNITSFNYTLSFEEGENKVLIRAIDRAGNEVFVDNSVYVDNTPPKILENNLGDLSPTYSRSVTVRGLVSEKATVKIAVNGDKNSNYQCSDGKDNDNDGKIDYPNDLGCNSPDDLIEESASYNYACSDGKDNDEDGSIDFPNDLGCDNPQDDDETNYEGEDTQCSDNIDNDLDGLVDFNPNGGGDWGCSGLSDDNEGDDPDVGTIYTISTDDDGKFRKEITLGPQIASSFNGAPSVSVRPDSGDTSLDFQTAGEDNSVKLIAIDRAGLRSGEVNGNIEYTTCNSGSSDFIVVQKDVYPTSLIPDHIFQGIATISFTLELEYLGIDNGKDIEINGISMGSTRRLSTEDKEEWDMNLINPNNCLAVSNDNLNWHVTCRLNRYPADAYRNITKAYDDFKEQQSVKLPIDLVITYTESKTGVVGQRDSVVTKHQKICYDLDFLLDIRVDPDDIPRGLLNKSIEVLDKAIDTIDQILPIVTQTKWAVAIGCFGMMAFQYVSSIADDVACLTLGGSKNKIIDAYIKGSPNYQLKEDNQEKLFARLGLNENDDSSTVKSCIGVKEKQFQQDKMRAWLCERIFCPAVPSAQMYANEERDSSDSACNPEVLGESNSVQSSLGVISGQGDGKQTMCENEYEQYWETGCFAYNVIEESKKKYNADNGRKDGIMNLINGLSVCEFGKKDANNKGVAYTSGGHSVAKTTENGVSSTKLVNIKEKSVIEKNKELGEDSKVYDEAEVNGFTKEDEKLFSTTPNVGKSDGCVIAKPSLFDKKVNFETKSNVMLVGDEHRAMTKITNQGIDKIPKGMKGVSKDGKDPIYYGDQNGLIYYGYEGEDSVTQAKTYVISANRGGETENYDYSAKLMSADEAKKAKCLKSDLVDEYPNADILVDPTSSVINSIRCVCLPAVEGYLISIRNILETIKNCFQSILVTGEFSTGICKSILTQYLCDFVYDLFGCVVDSMSASFSATEPNKANPLQKAFANLKSAGNRIKTTTMKKYGNTKSFKTLFNERQIIHSMCLAAFGYDWKPDLMASISTNTGAIGINSTGMISPATRRFISSNPVDGSVSFVYHVGYFLTAGGPLNWRLELICSSSYDCRETDGYENGKCDCAQTNIVSDKSTTPSAVINNPYVQNTAGGNGLLTGERVRSIDGGVLEGGEVVGGGSNPYTTPLGTQGTGDLYLEIHDPVRYDKVRLCWYSTVENGKSGCVGPINIRQTGGIPPATCTFNLALGRFTCGIYSDGLATAYITRVNEYRKGVVLDDEPGKLAYGQGEAIRYDVNYVVISEDDPSVIKGLSSTSSETKNTNTPKYLQLTFKDENGKTLIAPIVTSSYLSIEDEGNIKFPTSEEWTAKALVGEENPGFEIEGSANEAISSGAVQGTKYFAKSFKSQVVTKSMLKGEGTSDNLLIIVYDGKNIKYDIQPEKSLIEPSTGTSPLTGESAVTRWTITNLNSLKDGGTLIANNEFLISGIDGSQAKFKTTLEKDNELNKCGTNNSNGKTILCITYFKLNPTSSDSLSKRCKENENEDLEWSTEFLLLDGTNYGGPGKGKTVVPENRENPVIVPLTISCNSEYDPTSATTRVCAKYSRLSYNCDCDGKSFEAGDDDRYCYGGDLHKELPECSVNEISHPDGKPTSCNYVVKPDEEKEANCMLLDNNKYYKFDSDGNKAGGVCADKICKNGEYVDLRYCTCKSC